MTTESTERIALAVIEARANAEAEAWKNMARYKWSNFGYWAGVWVHYNRLLKGTPHHMGSPWKSLVHAARDHMKKEEEATTE